MNIFSMIKKVTPTSYQQLQIRFRLLQMIAYYQPIGRRLLAKQTQLSERAIRTEMDELKEQGLVCYSKAGMSLTEEGQLIYAELAKQVSYLVTMTPYEEQVAKVLGIEFCKIVSREDQLGFAVEKLLHQLLPLGESIIAVTGGTTLAKLSHTWTNFLSQYRELLFVPARGGVGGSNSIQANSVSEQMAQKSGGQYESLHVPEHVGQEAYESLMKEESVARVIALMKQANCLLYSVGEASIMATRRGLSTEEQTQLTLQQAVGEVFGSFFNAAGKIVYQLPRVGLHLEDISTIPTKIAIVSGTEKAEALVAYAHRTSSEHIWFVLTEDVATMVLNGETRKK